MYGTISVADPDVLGSGSVSYSGRENLTKYAFWLGPVGPTDKENLVKRTKSTVLGNYLFETVRIRIRIKLTSRIWIRIRIKRVWIRNTGDDANTTQHIFTQNIYFNT